MTTAIDDDKPFCKIQNSIMIKTTQQRIEWNLNEIKGIYNKV